MRAPAMSFVLAALSALVAVAQQPTSTPLNRVPQGARQVFQAKGDGVQNYTCKKTPQNNIQWVPTPDAKLLDGVGKPIGTHLAGPTWKLNAGGQVQGQNPVQLADSKPEAGAIAWLFIQAKPGSATGSLAEVAYITRTETHGGVPPEAGCSSAQDLGKTAPSVHYTATYTFYTEK